MVPFSQLAPLTIGTLAWIPIAYWVYLDAAARGSSAPILWALVSAPFTPIILYYLLVYRSSNDRIHPPTRRETLTRAAAGSSVVAALAATTLAPPDPVTQVGYWTVAFVVAALLWYVLVYRRGRHGSVA